MSSGAPPEQDRQRCDQCDRTLSARTGAMSTEEGCVFCRENE